MATALALVAAGIFALSTVLQQRGGLRTPPLSFRHPSSFARLGGQITWLVGFALLIPGWILQAMALDRGRVAVIQPIFTMTIVFVLPLGWWLTAQVVTLSQALEAGAVVLGLSIFIVFGDPAGGRNSAPNWQWAVSIGLIVALCAIMLTFGGAKAPLSLPRRGLRDGRGGAVGTGGDALQADGRAAPQRRRRRCARQLDGVRAGDRRAARGAAAAGRAANRATRPPAVATGSVANPLVGVLLGIVLLQERLAYRRPGTRRLPLRLSARALAAAVAISLSQRSAVEKKAARRSTRPRSSSRPTPPASDQVSLEADQMLIPLSVACRSISASSSAVKSSFRRAPRFCLSCSTLLAPTSVEVIRGSRSVHASASCASV